ncbi:hypothetical protein MNV_690008 [Candidatus Methanoperedens nitroreducens]|uniref:Uncharacterized protein n=1 Tax=Candidatus Methanoperedens nitratireducens TaxID=1392998 RepID=A0A284VSR0_9EURY|nr:hypothetical protein MNV_690008 [Candidatus Methanoperedens nitroreducens]
MRGMIGKVIEMSTEMRKEIEKLSIELEYFFT